MGGKGPLEPVLDAIGAEGVAAGETRKELTLTGNTRRRAILTYATGLSMRQVHISQVKPVSRSESACDT